MALTLILGGARSGKTALAQERAGRMHHDVVYIATAQAHDQEMQERIQRHRQSRPPHWHLVEEPVYLARAVREHAAPDRTLLVDCLTLWLTNLLTHPEDPLILAEQKSALLLQLSRVTGDVILVNNETGLGIVPMGVLSRRFVDENGWLNQALGQLCHRVTLVVAGLPMELKGGNV
ncbi:MAG: bifunctional adenosylcobinamide kinase/adenosylcobinamide-phosphate guanylyltransferase [Magnetococcales bacterium]|nr:bifunctional adenosylcobinamide kinase/adenosylcobinamide-phosphate guanylyltransferase [Magnetococcales bacterium]